MAGHQLRSNKELKDLPPSSNKKFWGEDARINLVDKNSIPKMRVKEHFPIVRQGPYFVCKGCPYEHTIPLDPKKFEIKEGRLVRLDKTKNSN